METVNPGLSYSMLSSYMACAYKYKCLYIDKIKTDAPESGDMSFGTAVHLGLNDVLQGNEGTPLFEAYWETERGRNLRFGAFSYEKLAEIGVIFIERFKRLHRAKYVPFSMEQRLKGTFPSGVRAEGTPDFIGTVDGVPSIVDFKTSARAYDKFKLISNPQLYLYAELARQAFKYEAEQVVYLVFCKSDTRIQTLIEPIDKERMKSMLEMLGHYAEEVNLLSNAVENGSMELLDTDFPRNHNACQIGSFKCDFSERCWGKNAEA